MFTLYRYKNNTTPDGLFNKAHFVADSNGVIYKLSGNDTYIIGSYDIDINALEVCGIW